MKKLLVILFCIITVHFSYGQLGKLTSIKNKAATAKAKADEIKNKAASAKAKTDEIKNGATSKNDEVTAPAPTEVTKNKSAETVTAQPTEVKNSAVASKTKKILVNYSNKCGETMRIKYITPAGTIIFTTFFDHDWGSFEYYEAGTKFYRETDTDSILIYTATSEAQQTIKLCQ